MPRPPQTFYYANLVAYFAFQRFFLQNKARFSFQRRGLWVVVTLLVDIIVKVSDVCIHTFSHKKTKQIKVFALYYKP